eukprot:g6267.t1
MAFRFNFGGDELAPAPAPAPVPAPAPAPTPTPTPTPAVPCEFPPVAAEELHPSFADTAHRLDTAAAQRVPISGGGDGDAQPLTLLSVGDGRACLRSSSDGSGGDGGGGGASAVELDSRLRARNTDIITGVYEGGLKLWECAIDLSQYLWWECASAPSRAGAPASPLPPLPPLLQLLRGSTVAELGCGHALPGVVALLCGARALHLLDYNKEVLRDVAAPNVVLNALAVGTAAGAGAAGARAAGALAARVRYFAGDWLDLSRSLLAAGRGGRGGSEGGGGGGRVQYGLVLSAECVYTADATARLCRMLHAHLRHPDGVALVAAKRYYFGTGGGVGLFKQLIEDEGGSGDEGGSQEGMDRSEVRRLRARTVWTAEDTQSNIREIVRVEFVRP